MIVIFLQWNSLQADLSLQCFFQPKKNIYHTHRDSSAVHLFIILNPARVTETRM